MHQLVMGIQRLMEFNGQDLNPAERKAQTETGGFIH